MSFNPRITGRPSRTREWRAIEQANQSQYRQDRGIGSLVALSLLGALVLVALFALPV